jgi:hypothetical protein
MNKWFVVFVSGISLFIASLFSCTNLERENPADVLLSSSSLALSSSSMTAESSSAVSFSSAQGLSSLALSSSLVGSSSAGAVSSSLMLSSALENGSSSSFSFSSSFHLSSAVEMSSSVVFSSSAQSVSSSVAELSSSTSPPPSSSFLAVSSSSSSDPLPLSSSSLVSSSSAAPVNSPPTIDSYSVSPTEIEVGDMVTLQVSWSDPDGVGDVESISWDYEGDGVYDYTAGSSTISISYYTAGSFIPRVLVRDGEESVWSDMQTLVVNEALSSSAAQLSSSSMASSSSSFNGLLYTSYFTDTLATGGKWVTYAGNDAGSEGTFYCGETEYATGGGVDSLPLDCIQPGSGIIMEPVVNWAGGYWGYFGLTSPFVAEQASAYDLSSWSKICLEYESMANFTLQVGTFDDENNLGVYGVRASAATGQFCYNWDQFEQPSWYTDSGDPLWDFNPAQGKNIAFYFDEEGQKLFRLIQVWLEK